VLAQAIKEANSTDGTKIKDAMKGMSFTNVMGKTVKFDDHNQAGHWVALHTVQNRKVTLADMVEVK
jgi:ABC-type branched-subunit amino acid transport system substrate-binding protein